MFEIQITTRGVPMPQVHVQIDAVIRAHRQQAEQGFDGAEDITIVVHHCGVLEDFVCMAMSLGLQGFSLDGASRTDVDQYHLWARLTLPVEIPF